MATINDESTDDTKSNENTEKSIILQQKITLNSISLQFENAGNVTSVSCYHYKQPSDTMAFMGFKGEWIEINSKSIDITMEYVSFHFLEIGEIYNIIFYNNDSVIMEKKFECIDHDNNYSLASDSIDIIGKLFGINSSIYISPSIFDLDYNQNDKVMNSPMSLEWIIESNNDNDWMWYCQSDNIKDEISLIKLLILNGLFVLPHGSVAKKLTDYFGDEATTNPKIKMMVQRYSQQIMLCPNPQQRQIIDFRINKVNWSRNKKLKKYKKNFYLSINYNFKQDLKLCKDYHIEKEFKKQQQEQKEQKEQDQKQNDSGDKEDGTWITDNFIEILDKLKQDETKNDILKFITFELWDKETNEIVAASFAYIIGSICCDYTFMTLKRDKRSCGNILTKVIGDILKSCNYDIWYWGFRLDYMTDYDKYGGKEINRNEFANILINSCKQSPNILNQANEQVLDIIQFIKTGKALIEPLPEWV